MSDKKQMFYIMKNMMKLLFVFSICLNIFTSCQSDEGSNLNDAFGNVIENTELQNNEENDQNTQGNANENINEQNNYLFQNPNNIDYSAYKTLVHSYRKALSSSYGELTNDYMGYFYANLMDFNDDDVYELVIARIYNSDTEGNVDEMFNISSEYFIGSRPNDYVHVYYLNDDGTVGNAGEFPLSFYGEEGMQFNIEYTEVDGRNYLVFGGDLLNFGITSADYVFAKSIMGFNGEYFEIAEMFAIEYDYVNAGYEAKGYRQDMEPVTQETFNTEFYDKWYKNPTQHIFVAQGYDTNTDEITQNTIDFLDNFELKDTHGDAFTYANGNFVIYERSYIGEEEIPLKYLLDAITYHDFASMQVYIDDENIIDNYKISREDEQYYPGLIVEEIEYLYPISYAWADMQLMQTILENDRYAELYRQNGLEGTFVLKVDAKEIIDMEVVQYAGQFGLNITQYYMFETDEDGSNPKLTAIYNDNFFWGNSEVYDVSYITDYEQIFNAYGYEYPVEIMEMYFTQEEISNMDHYITENANEVYFIRNLWGGTMKIYESYINENMEYTRGELLHETSSNVLYLACSSDNVVETGMYTDVQIVTEPFAGYEAVYHPAVSHPDTWIHLGGYAQEMQRVN